MIKEQEQLIKETSRIVEIFKTSKDETQPHFVVTGPSGSSKSHTI